MRASEYLSDEDFARYFLQANTVAPGADVLDLEPRVEAWLSRAGMGHRSAFAIAIQVTKLVKPEPPPPRVPSPEQAAFEVNQAEGIGDQVSDAILAARVRDMDLATYSRERGRLGVYKSTLDFLGGT